MHLIIIIADNCTASSITHLASFMQQRKHDFGIYDFLRRSSLSNKVCLFKMWKLVKVWTLPFALTLLSSWCTDFKIFCFLLTVIPSSSSLINHASYIVICVLNKTYLYILPEISAHHLQLKCIGGHFVSVPSLHREYYRTL